MNLPVWCWENLNLWEKGGDRVFVLITVLALNVFIAWIRENGFCLALRWITCDHRCLHPKARVLRPMAQQLHYTTKRVNQVRRATPSVKSHNLLLSDKQRQPKIRLAAPWFIPIVPSKPQHSRTLIWHGICIKQTTPRPLCVRLFIDWLVLLFCWWCRLRANWSRSIAIALMNKLKCGCVDVSHIPQ